MHFIHDELSLPVIHGQLKPSSRLYHTASFSLHGIRENVTISRYDFNAFDMHPMKLYAGIKVKTENKNSFTLTNLLQ